MENECLIASVGGLCMKTHLKIDHKGGVLVMKSFAQYCNTDLMCIRIVIKCQPRQLGCK